MPWNLIWKWPKKGHADKGGDRWEKVAVHLDVGHQGLHLEDGIWYFFIANHGQSRQTLRFLDSGPHSESPHCVDPSGCRKYQLFGLSWPCMPFRFASFETQSCRCIRWEDKETQSARPWCFWKHSWQKAQRSSVTFWWQLWSWFCGFDCEIEYTKIYRTCVIVKQSKTLFNFYFSFKICNIWLFLVLNYRWTDKHKYKLVQGLLQKKI